MKTSQTQLALFFCGLVLIYLMFQLPTSVIETNDDRDKISSAISIEKALKLIECNNPMEGIFMLREIIENNPKNVEALYALGFLSLQTAQYENAANRFNQIITIDSSDKKAYLQLGISNYYLDNYNEADSLFNLINMSGDTLLIKELQIFLRN